MGEGGERRVAGDGDGCLGVSPHRVHTASIETDVSIYSPPRWFSPPTLDVLVTEGALNL